MKHISEIFKKMLLLELEKLNESYHKKQIDKVDFEKRMNDILDKINEMERKLKK